ncbi:hypothetical protein WDU94_011801 [Cyamophila willieti]
MGPLQLACCLFLVILSYQHVVRGYEPSSGSCSSDQVQCRDSTTCIEKSQICDGVTNCENEDDEYDCDAYFCKAPSYFKCKDDGCITMIFTCDGSNDCLDGSDEANCTIESIIGDSEICGVSDFRCASGKCVSQHWVCDGDADCADGSDEAPEECKTKIDCDLKTDYLCENHICIVKDWVCDGFDDCGDNSDEKNCPPRDVMEDCLAINEKFKCHDNLKCITYDKLCDTHADCNDGSDESGQCSTVCPSSCQFKCKQTPSGPVCYCPPGTHTSTQNNSCVDIDECVHFGICDQLCTNTYGSYVCSCEHGFELQSDGKTCKVKDGGDAILYFSTYDEVRTINLNSGLETPVATGLKHVAGVACDGQSLYWSSIYEGEETIYQIQAGWEREGTVWCQQA